MGICDKRFDYTYTAVNDLGVETEQDRRSGQPKVKAVLVHGEPLEPTDRFWTSLYARFGFSGYFFKYFQHNEVLDRIAKVENDQVRVCIERNPVAGKNRLLAVSSPNKPLVLYDDLMATLGRYEGRNIVYGDGVVESTHVPRAGANTFNICGDEFSNRFVMSVPVDGYGLPNIYLSLLRHICTNGAVGYAKAFRSSLALGKGSDDVNYSVVRALEGFGNDEGFAALRSRFDAAGKSWASVNEAQSLYKHLLKMLYHKHVGWSGASVAGEIGMAPPFQNGIVAPALADNAKLPEEISSPIITKFHALTGDVSGIYGISNPDALSVKRQRTLPTRAKVYDLLNFVSEVATHHADEFGARSSQAWLGSLTSGEFDLENSCESYGDFRDFFLDKKLDGETSLEIQRLQN